MSRYQLVGGEPTPACERAHLRDFHPVAGDVIGLAGFDRVHDRSRVVAELALSDHLHNA
jgi:hypothetical protein